MKLYNKILFGGIATTIAAVVGYYFFFNKRKKKVPEMIPYEVTKHGIQFVYPENWSIEIQDLLPTVSTIMLKDPKYGIFLTMCFNIEKIFIVKL